MVAADQLCAGALSFSVISMHGCALHSAMERSQHGQQPMRSKSSMRCKSNECSLTTSGAPHDTHCSQSPRTRLPQSGHVIQLSIGTAPVWVVLETASCKLIIHIGEIITVTVIVQRW